MQGRIIDLTHSASRRTTRESVPIVVRSVDAVDRIPLDRLVTLATVVDLRRRANSDRISRADMAGTGVADIGGCILLTGYCDGYLAGARDPAPVLQIAAAAYLLEGGVRTVASDFPITADAAEMLLYNGCVLAHCLSGVAELTRPIVRLIALPLKLDDAFSAEARVIAIEE